MSIIKSFWGVLKTLLDPVEAIIPKWVKNVRNITAQSLLRAAYKLMDIDETALKAGLPFTQQEFQKLLRPAVLEGEKRTQLAKLLPNEFPDYGDMVEVSFGRPHRYRYFYNAEVFNYETGELQEKWVSFYADEKMSMADLQRLLDDNAFPFYYDDYTSIKLIEPTAVWHNIDSKLY